MSYVKLRTYVSMRSKIIKQEVKLSSVVCPYEGFKSMGGSPGSREASRDACKGVASGCEPPVPWGGEMWRAQDNGFTKQY